MAESKQAVVDVKKGWLNVSLTALAAIGSASGNLLIAGVTAIPATIVQAGTLNPLFEKQRSILETLPQPVWWTEGTPKWQAVCTNIEHNMPAIMDGVAEHLKELHMVPTAESIKVAFTDEVYHHLPTWEVKAQDRAMLAREVTPRFLASSATALREVVEPIREDALADMLSRVAKLLDDASKQGMAVAPVAQTIEGSIVVLPEDGSSTTERELAAQLEKKLQDGKYDVYVSYHDEDEDAVMKIGEDLKTKGLLPWFDSEDTRPGELVLAQMEEQIEKIPAAAVFVGLHPIIDVQRLQIYTFIGQFVTRKLPVIPVLLPTAPSKPKLPPFLGNFAWVDFRKSNPDPLDRLTWGITGKRPGS